MSNSVATSDDNPAQVSLASVEDQINEETIHQQENDRKISLFREGIKLQQEAKEASRARQSKLRAKARIFRRAAFQLREVDSN